MAASNAVVLNDNVYYKIFNAYGGDSNDLYKYPTHKLVEKENRGNIVFGRKVIKAWNNIWARPVSFGRITLW